MLASSDIEYGKVTVELQPDNAEIEARIRYEGFDSWSAWISPNSPVSREKLEISINLLCTELYLFLCLGP